ncbi:MAG: sugar phosphate isomerase/epimerase [Verrucomicrobiales bacterium]|nr:sugar phosphate isomerase/epimerase [Verrucomicrobiales bacterium]
MIALSRRQFLGSAAAVLAATGVRAMDPITRIGPPRLRLSLAAYSFRQFFRDGRDSGKSQIPAARQIDLFQFIDYCAEHGCDGTELTSYYFPKEFDDAYLLNLRRHAFLRGVSVSGTAVGNTFTLPAGEKRQREIAGVKKWIEHARVLGAPHIRVFAGNLEGQPLADAKRNCIAALEECADAAGQAGVFLGIENHGGIVAEPGDLLDIIKAVKSPWVGINLDSGNFHSADPYADLAVCAPYAVNVQVKVEIRRKDAQAEPSDLPKLVKILREARYQGWVALEYESAEDPYVAVPRHLQALAPLLRAAS